MSSLSTPISTPVVLVIFKRPNTTRRVLETIREAEPPELFVVADGPREHVEGEAEACRETRALVEKGVDWDCTVHTNYSTENMGGPKRIPSGINWAFEHTDRAIILEDDFLPILDFFHFCDALLERYSDDDDVMHIGGNNAGVPPQTEASYFYSNLSRTGGWATWADSWQEFDPEMTEWTAMRSDETLFDLFHTEDMARAHVETFESIFQGNWDAWDAIWQYSILANDGKTLLPTENLVKHIGWGAAAQHNEEKPYFLRFALPDYGSLAFPLSHPSERESSEAFERNLWEYKRGYKMRILRLMDQAIHKFF